jgi:hypothetical protein
MHYTFEFTEMEGDKLELTSLTAAPAQNLGLFRGNWGECSKECGTGK